MEHKSEGVCRCCRKTFAGSAMSRHLKSCKVKAEHDAREAAEAPKAFDIFNIRLSAGKYYWLHIEIPANATLQDLDDFLRGIWLECCGHLTAFTIDGMTYEKLDGDKNLPFAIDVNTYWEPEVRSIDIKMSAVLLENNTFRYEYDFGSTTTLDGKIIGKRRGYLNEKARILARNNPYRFDCAECSQNAAHLCVECDVFYCDTCLEAHECGEEMALSVVNSPRMGVCGFTGGFIDDEFELA